MGSRRSVYCWQDLRLDSAEGWESVHGWTCLTYPSRCYSAPTIRERAFPTSEPSSLHVEHAHCDSHTATDPVAWREQDAATCLRWLSSKRTFQRCRELETRAHKTGLSSARTIDNGPPVRCAISQHLGPVLTRATEAQDGGRETHVYHSVIRLRLASLHVLQSGRMSRKRTSFTPPD
jgi:hypothetical protein